MRRQSVQPALRAGLCPLHPGTATACLCCRPRSLRLRAPHLAGSAGLPGSIVPRRNGEPSTEYTECASSASHGGTDMSRASTGQGMPGQGGRGCLHGSRPAGTATARAARTLPPSSLGTSPGTLSWPHVATATRTQRETKRPSVLFQAEWPWPAEVWRRKKVIFQTPGRAIKPPRAGTYSSPCRQEGRVGINLHSTGIIVFSIHRTQVLRPPGWGLG